MSTRISSSELPVYSAFCQLFKPLFQSSKRATFDLCAQNSCHLSLFPEWSGEKTATKCNFRKKRWVPRIVKAPRALCQTIVGQGLWGNAPLERY